MNSNLTRIRRRQFTQQKSRSCDVADVAGATCAAGGGTGSDQSGISGGVAGGVGVGGVRNSQAIWSELRRRFLNNHGMKASLSPTTSSTSGATGELVKCDKSKVCI